MTVMENHDKCVRAQYVIYNKSLMIITFIKDNEPYAQPRNPLE